MTRRPPSAVPASRRQFLTWTTGALATTGLAATGCSAPESGSGSAKAAGASPSATALTRIGLDYPFTQLPLHSTLVKLSTAAAKKHDVRLLTTVHALLGHNGAGKSTLIKCLGGAYPPDAGTIEVGGVPYHRLSPRDSIAAGVAIIFQTLSVVDSLTENIFLGQEWTRYGRIDRRAQERVAAELLHRVAASCSPRDRVGELPMGQKQLVEIAKALSRSASVLVLDEPTAALSGTESDALAARVEDLRRQGLAIVYVTHLLAEVERLADAVTVLRDGRVAHHSATGGHNRRELVEAITGGRGTVPSGAAGGGTAASRAVSSTGTVGGAGGLGSTVATAAGAEAGTDAGTKARTEARTCHGSAGTGGRGRRRAGGEATGQEQAGAHASPRSPAARLTVRGLRGPGFGLQTAWSRAPRARASS
ncbi:ATP-binding cassette domain-containing protein [Streptomyces adelaidensis]|uniref:ATP-binding cassette domain-containing protein n=1 Tax=Streptomyces adelaidensis TaxID=2796465 RepID=UPI001F2E8AA3|nr:ATP-binding cassette domain-containing protein [Streptomyces adelaidensis]